MENENKNKKRLSVISIVVIIIVLIIIIAICLKLFVFNNSNNKSLSSNSSEISSIEGDEYVELDGNTKINTSSFLQEEKYLNDFTFSNFYVYSIDGITRMEFDVYNDSDSRQVLDNFRFIIYDADNEVGSIVCDGDEFASKQTKRLSVVINCDVANMFDVSAEQIYNKVI